MTTKIKIEYEDRETLQFLRVEHTKDRKFCSHFMDADQFNIEFSFDNQFHGFGFTRDMTRNEVAKGLIELAADIMEKK